ncbi:MAG: V-type ATPase subunit [Spirochaetia bacterium]
MAGQLHAYRYINAKLRTRIGKLLDYSFFRSLAGVGSLDTAVSRLAEQGLTEVAQAYRDTGDVRVCEQRLYHREIGILLEVERYLDGSRRDFVAMLGDRYEIENVKTALRLWFESVRRGKHVESKINYLSREVVHRDIDLDGIVNAASAEDIPVVLEGTPYAAPVARNLESIQRTGSLFFTERALDYDYFERMLELARDLPKPDREPALRSVALEADRENVSWIMRAINYYGLDEKDALASILPGGTVFDEKTLREAVRSGRSTAVLLDRLGRSSTAGVSREGGRHARGIALIEAALDEETYNLAHRYLGTYPFTMGVVLAYYMLTRRQIRRIMAVLNGLYYGLDAETMEAAL